MLNFFKNQKLNVTNTFGIGRWQASAISGQRGLQIPLTVTRLVRPVGQNREEYLDVNVTGLRCEDDHGQRFTFWVVIRTYGESTQFMAKATERVTATVEVDLTQGKNSWIMTILDVKPLIVMRRKTS